MKPVAALMDALALQQRRDVARLVCEIGRTDRYLEQAPPRLQWLINAFGLRNTDYSARFPAMKSLGQDAVQFGLYERG